MTKRVIMTKGAAASGKTTWAKQLVESEPGRWKIVCRDDLRRMFDAGKWSRQNEKMIVKARDALILLALEEGYHVIVADTNLPPKNEQGLRELVKGKAVVEVKDFTDVPEETCLERNIERQYPVREAVIRRQYAQYINKPTFPPVYGKMLPEAVIVDIDGTLAIHNGRSPYDEARCEEDLLNQPVADLLITYHQTHLSTSILLVSGRRETSRERTYRWLGTHTLPWHALFMRAEDDDRNDAIVKREIYEREIAGKYNVRFCLDDRSRTVAVWRSLGIPCLQVAEGDF